MCCVSCVFDMISLEWKWLWILMCSLLLFGMMLWFCRWYGLDKLLFWILLCEYSVLVCVVKLVVLICWFL